VNIKDLVGSKLQSEKAFSSLESPNAPFAKTVLFEVVPEDFEWNPREAEHRLIHLCALK
jgi:hypothetical protein